MDPHNSKAFVSVLALFLVSILVVLAVAYTSAGSTSLIQSDNHRLVFNSLNEAESGLAFLTYQVKKVTLSPGLSGQNLLNALGGSLAARLNGTTNLNGGSVLTTTDLITIPRIATDGGRSFTGQVTLGSSGAVKVHVTGSDSSVSRAVSIEFNLAGKSSHIFDYGIASKSAIVMTGNASVKGANSPREADIYSATYSKQEAFKFNGNTTIDGDIFSAAPDSYATLIGNNKIGGVSSSDPNINDHIHLGVENVDFPEVDPTVFEPYATTVVDGTTSFNGNKTFTNIRIKANTNPSFSGNITIKGVVFIEQPNKVQFTGNLDITGVIVTQDAGDNSYTTNTLKFMGNTSSHGVESLPDTPQFHDLRQKTGSFLLAPGFGVSFTGNFGTVNGCMAADSFTFTGNAGGIVNGPVINYSDSDFSLTGNAMLTINRNNVPHDPPGFASSSTLTADADSYVEY
ncbi:MAG: hypothetical protein WC869_03825 [Phycisphaerae bacterium]|jgi:hypothetical protein